MPLAEAQALVPRGVFVTTDREADRDQLRQLAWRCQRFTPRAGLEEADRPASLWLDVTGCDHLFGDLVSLCQEVIREFRMLGHAVRIAVAGTFGAAWGLARFCRERPAAEPFVIQQTSDRERTLSRLPVESLRLVPKTLELLRECGLRTVGQLRGLPRATLPSRFGPELLLRLDQMFGDREELLAPECPPIPIRVEQRWDHPLTDPESVLHVVEELLRKLIDQLASARQNTACVQLSWKLEQGDAPELTIRLLRPTQQFQRVWELLTLQLERVQFPHGVLGLSIEATPCCSDAVRRTTLFDHDQDRERNFESLIERLTSRLGETVVGRYRLLPEPQPEFSVLFEPWTRAKESPQSEEQPRAERPFRLLSPPISTVLRHDPRRMTWQGQEQQISLWDGPERVVTGWWRTCGCQRDYYRVETMTGQRFWLFQRLGTTQWFVQGLFD